MKHKLYAAALGFALTTGAHAQQTQPVQQPTAACTGALASLPGKWEW